MAQDSIRKRNPIIVSTARPAGCAWAVLLSKEIKLPDLEYKTNGIFTMFFANTDIGAAAYGAIAAANGGIGNIPTAHLESTLSQLRAAGITIKKHREKSACKQEGDDLLADLGISV